MAQTLRPEAAPGTATPENGQVTLDGPDGVAVAMTPAAAIETGRRLIAAAEIAAKQALDESTDDDGE